ncbi:MAG: DUF4124 domain-containing protein [Gammaproteobacteria bacterium]|nr:DUF4124 domain-containing protein [Gammaproteobacteria bacterium]
MKRSLFLAALLAAATADAAVYRCTGADGATTYSQTPCSAAAERVVVDKAPGSTGTSADCRVAEPFSRAVAKMMKQRLSKDETIAEFGGPGALKSGAGRLVNYVYLYGASPNMTQERIVTLTMAQCGSGAFGDVSCPALPNAYTEAGGGCEGEFSEFDADPQVNVFARNREKSDARARERSEQMSAQTDKMKADYAQRERSRQCREAIQRKIDQIDISIQAGADPNGHKLPLRRLRKQQSECG